MKRLCSCLAIISLLAGCAAGSKKVIVLSQGTANINTDNRTITTAGRGHEEKTVLFHDEGKVDLAITTPAGNATVSLEGTGIFLVNTKQDTIIGSFVNYTAPKTVGEKITEAQLRADIDSLQKIVNGEVSLDKKTFYILPNTAVKITSNENAQVVTPYHQMTSIAVKKGETPEVYRFYPISEARATLTKLKGFLGEDRAINDPQ